jgi:hypothetical protein
LAGKSAPHSLIERGEVALFISIPARPTRKEVENKKSKSKIERKVKRLKDLRDLKFEKNVFRF